MNKSTIKSIGYMYRTEGLSGLFKGNLLNLAGTAPFSAFEFYFYKLF
jgi:hypothetical protein